MQTYKYCTGNLLWHPPDSCLLPICVLNILEDTFYWQDAFQIPTFAASYRSPLHMFNWKKNFPPKKVRSRTSTHAYVELLRLMQNLERGRGDLVNSLVSQLGYFYIITPEDFSEALSEEWSSIRAAMGINPGIPFSNALEAKGAMRAKLGGYTPQELETLVGRIPRLYERVGQELAQ